MRIETKCIQEGYKPANGEPRVLPIFQSTTFKYDTGEQIANLFDLKESGFFYSRLANPTVDAVEKKISALEGGVGAMLTSSGQAATLTTIMTICKSGDHILSSGAIYGGTTNLFNVTLKRFGIEFTLVNQDAPLEELEKEIKPNTKAIFGETLANPALKILDIEKFATLAKNHNIPFIIDNTFPTPILCRPFEHGANIVIHSGSKYFDGHATTLSGAIIDGGNFDWSNGNFPEFTTPDDSYHGLVYSDAFKESAFIIKARVQIMRDTGMMLSPHSAFLLNIGLETLHLRIERHCENALAVAKFLETQEKIEKVFYPGLESDSSYELGKKYMPKGSSGVVSFNLKGTRKDCSNFMESLELAEIVVHVADARTSVLHPASTTHRQLTDDQLKEAGISSNLIRMSIGLENIDDIIEDIQKALNEI